MHIFLVEDHPDTLASITRHLRRCGHEVESARTLAEALRKLPETPCDLLLTDLGLPDGDGWTLLERLGADRPPFAVAMSGYGGPADFERSAAAGFQEHLIKPFPPEELDGALRRVTANEPA